MADPTSGGGARGRSGRSRTPRRRVPTRRAPPRGSGAPLGGWTPAAPPAAPPPVPVDLRPLTALERVDGGLRVLKLAPATMVAIAACTVVPVQLLGALVPDDPAHPADPMLVAWLGRGAAITFAEDSDRARARRVRSSRRVARPRRGHRRHRRPRRRLVRGPAAQHPRGPRRRRQPPPCPGRGHGRWSTSPRPRGPSSSAWARWWRWSCSRWCRPSSPPKGWARSPPSVGRSRARSAVRPWSSACA